jgi:hypothetical protein
MKDLTEPELGLERIYALVNAEDVLKCLGCDEHREEATFYLAVLGWTVGAFVYEVGMTRGTWPGE